MTASLAPIKRACWSFAPCLISNNTIVNILNGDSELIESADYSGINDYNHDNTDPKQIYSVVDADSSQQDAILLAKRGASFVLQGPPGTGKSQTITNIIAELLAQGKSVLFVSEKLAALQVVYNRLSAAGIGDFCLRQHRTKNALRLSTAYACSFSVILHKTRLITVRLTTLVLHNLTKK